MQDYVFASYIVKHKSFNYFFKTIKIKKKKKNPKVYLQQKHSGINNCNK